ncbi:MAG: ATP-binding protein, partial [Aggregatilineales bacterium]
FRLAEENALLQSSIAVSERAVTLYERYRNEAQRVAFTSGIPEAIQARQVTSLQQILEGLAATANLDSIIVTDVSGTEVAGILRVNAAQFTDYSIGSETDLSNIALIQQVIEAEVVGVSGLLRSPEGTLLYVAVPIYNAENLSGVAMVGQRLDSIITALQSGAVAEVSLFGADGNLLATSFDLNNAVRTGLSLDTVLVEQIAVSGTPVQATTPLDNTRYHTIYTPFVFGQNVIGFTGTTLPDNLPFVTSISRQITALLASAVMGSIVIAAFTLMNLLTARLNRVTETAVALAQGEVVRTNMKPTDEIGAIGQALDSYADAVKIREDKFQTMLRRQRRERNYFLSVLESMPDGVIVQDSNGEILMMNQTARELVGQESGLDKIAGLESLLQGDPGEVLAPGLYVLGDPRRIQMQGKMLNAQAAAILSPAKKRIGTVLVVRDITDEIQEEQERASLLTKLSEEIQQPLAGLAQRGALQDSQPVTEFAREISRHAATLQRMIVEMRELTRYNPDMAAQRQRPVPVETLVWALANDWRQIARVANLELQIAVGKKGLFIPGDESRLRRAIGNILDNAIKYTPPGGAISLEIYDEVDGMVYLRIRDNGTGIAREELDAIFMPFYRGTPVTQDNQVIRVPGMGQG